MKEAKKEYYKIEILNYLMNKEVVSTSQLAEAVGMSEKSIRNKIYEINEFLKENDMGIIQKKPRVGIWLECNDEQKERIQAILINKNATFNRDEDSNRMDEVLKIFFKLRPWETVTTQKLANELYLSSPTILKVIRECEKWLLNYNVSIVNEKNKGYRLDCNENEYRIAMKNFLMKDFNVEKIKSNIDYFFYNIDTKLIQKAIIETENEWNYRFTDESFYEIFIYCCIAYQRKDIQSPVVKDENEIMILQKYNEYPFTVAIFKKLQDKFHILFSNEEVFFLATQMMCSKFIGISAVDEMVEQVSKYDNRLIDFVDMSLRIVGSILDVDLSKDEKLKESLIFHLRPTIFRIRHGFSHTNSLSNFIKTEYKNVFRATMSISILFEEYYGLQLTEDEVGYIVLYIQSAIERMHKHFKVVLIVDSNRAQAQLISERINKSIREIESIKIMSTHDFKLYGDSEGDIVVATTQLDIKDPRIIVIPNLLSESGIVSLREKMTSLFYNKQTKERFFSPECYPLLDLDLLFVEQEFNTREEVLRFMAQSMVDHGYVTKHFIDTVMERENATTTCIGNNISVTHGAQSEVIESKVSIAVLKKPIPWNDEEEVDMVFLLGFKMASPDEIKRIQLFYKEYISIIEKEENIEKIKSMKTNIDLYKFLIQ
ncbi:MAG: BglG family transcription antiterminator [Erysipelotrichaceae bacterium]|uniref:BglG family transcription antiterminator n=1 Tax=Floccifex sp. TaxID=2815810 RepID=UPI002A7655FA|nr:BglG family transcription antiterminator [Floccifex sp.]MDD7281739.1 BglG family transcription antiterminator [Erysipelotrichaceae bacterium]MDY2958614.1 BglG family transcription antiterminator [Floccifex sp.]